jgi:hypothetical protein
MSTMLTAPSHGAESRNGSTPGPSAPSGRVANAATASATAIPAIRRDSAP